MPVEVGHGVAVPTVMVLGCVGTVPVVMTIVLGALTLAPTCAVTLNVPLVAPAAKLAVMELVLLPAVMLKPVPL